MKLSKDEKEQIITGFVIARMEEDQKYFKKAIRTTDRISKIKTYGEVVGTTVNRNLKSESHAYRYVTHGVQLEINEAFDFLSKILESQPIAIKLKRRMQKLQNQYEKKIRQIEEKYPRGTNPLKARIREARPAVMLYIEHSEELAKSIIQVTKNSS